MDTDFLSPLSLAVEPFTIGGDGAEETPDPTKLINPNRSAMLVDSFRFHVGLATVGANGLDFASMMAKLTFGSTPLTNQFIPLPAFAPLYFAYPLDALGNGDSGDCTLTWHLARPLYVPPDVQVGVSFKRKIPIASWASDINTSQPWGFSIAGRSMPAGMEIPEKIFVPWACATSVYSSTLPFMSSDADITNPFDEPLNIDYFTGFNMRDIIAGTRRGTSRTPITFQATLSSGKVLARDPTPFNLLFPPDRPILRTRGLLQPKEFVSVVIDVPQPTVDDSDAVFTTVGMTGWRELPTPQGALP